jgi:hypothetical protein
MSPDWLPVGEGNFPVRYSIITHSGGKEKSPAEFDRARFVWINVQAYRFTRVMSG